MECTSCESNLRNKLESVEKVCNNPEIYECYIDFSNEKIDPMCDECRLLLKNYLDHRSKIDSMSINSVDNNNIINNSIEQDTEEEIEEIEDELEDCLEDDDVNDVNESRIPINLSEFINICIEWCDANPKLLKEMRAINVSHYIEKGLLERYDCRYCRKVGKKYNGHPWGQCPNYHRAINNNQPRITSTSLVGRKRICFF
jgi:hypothetical protein